MKWNLAAKPEKENTTAVKKFVDDVISTNSGIIIIFPLKVHFGAIRKSESGCMICKTNISISSSFLSYQNWNQNWKSQAQLSHYCF